MVRSEYSFGARLLLMQALVDRGAMVCAGVRRMESEADLGITRALDTTSTALSESSVPHGEQTTLTEKPSSITCVSHTPRIMTRQH